MTTNLNQIEMSSSAASQALDHAVRSKDWKTVRKIIRDDMDNVAPEERQEVLRLIKERRLNSQIRMQLRKISHEEIKVRDPGNNIPGLYYLIRQGDVVKSGHFYGGRKDRDVEFIDSSGFHSLDTIDEIFEITLQEKDASHASEENGG